MRATKSGHECSRASRNAPVYRQMICDLVEIRGGDPDDLSEFLQLDDWNHCTRRGARSARITQLKPDTLRSDTNPLVILNVKSHLHLPRLRSDSSQTCRVRLAAQIETDRANLPR
jgi:hypothetical protein